MVAYACNISCKGCISLSDIPRKGTVSTKDVENWCDFWKDGISPSVVTLFGGEPLLNKNIATICQTVRAAWPASIIRLVTNGYLLDRFPPDQWYSFGNFEMQVSVHRQDHESIINQNIRLILKHHKDWKTVIHKNHNHHRQIEFSRPGFRLWKSKFKNFVTPYRLSDGKMMPFKGSAEHAHKICGSPDTPILYKGKLYKCPPVANLIDITDENWSNYKACTDLSELDEFVRHIGRPESVCSQCPDNIGLHTYDHFDINNVRIKKNLN